VEPRDKNPVLVKTIFLFLPGGDFFDLNMLSARFAAGKQARKHRQRGKKILFLSAYDFVEENI